MDVSCVVTEDDISELIGHFSKETYKCSNAGTFGLEVSNKCASLIGLDYVYKNIENERGRINDQYPQLIPIPMDEKPSRNSRTERTSTSSVEDSCPKVNGNRKRNNLGSPSPPTNLSPDTYVRSQSPRQKSPLKNGHVIVDDIEKVEKLVNEAKLARCRNRFVVPVIFFQGKYICRSSTIARMTEIGLGALSETLDLDELLHLDKKRKSDVDLLKMWNVGTIIDLMVENEKQKYLISVTSSEKIDKSDKYKVFRVVPTPYPGCEFFLDFKKNNYNSEGLKFDWTASPINSVLNVKPNPAVDQLDIKWSEYKEWDLKQLTENYLSLMLKYIWCSSKGILIHCISGWDRTPMFISLLRMSLWADGVIHKSLSPCQILYLTIAYDWYLFGHNLENRLAKGEDILHFCFHFLKYIFSDDFKTPVPPLPATAPNSPKYSSNNDEFDLTELEQLEIRSQHNNSNGSYDDLSNGKMCDTNLDESNGTQFDIDRNDVTKFKPIKKPAEKFRISETIYEQDYCDKFISEDMADEIETKRYKCASPRRRHRSHRSTDGESDLEDFDTLDDEKTVSDGYNIPTTLKHPRARTISNSSETDEWSIVTQTGSLNGNDFLSDNKFRYISTRENKLSAVRELFYKKYSTYGYKTDSTDGLLKLHYNSLINHLY